MITSGLGLARQHLKHVLFSEGMQAKFPAPKVPLNTAVAPGDPVPYSGCLRYLCANAHTNKK